MAKVEQSRVELFKQFATAKLSLAKSDLELQRAVSTVEACAVKLCIIEQAPNYDYTTFFALVDYVAGAKSVVACSIKGGVK